MLFRSIEDILIEVQTQIESLENQVEKAKEFQELSDRLREDEVSLFAHNYNHFKTEQSTLRSSLDGELAKESETLAEISGLEARHLELQSQLDEADPDIQALQEKIALMREKIARAESTLKNAGERMDSGARRLTSISEELAEDDANLKVLETQVDASRQELSQAENVAKALKDAIESFETEVEAADEAAQVYQSRMDEFEDEIKNLERLIEIGRAHV